ncbi:lanthionine synthetase C family protein [Actinoalloteichus caeruleus]|uniref:lanthionine synthetase C family protein n=1 Tax=Actinoalloteichus cyanogriseus TaxID=2893586 RepID=UPI003BB895AD
MTHTVTSSHSPPAPRLAPQASALAERIADVLRDARNLEVEAEDGSREPWQTLSLASGYAGISVLFSDRVSRDPAERLVAHRYLGMASAGLAGRQDLAHGLHYEVAGLGFALDLARRAGGGYATSLATIDALVIERVRRLRHLVRTTPLDTMARFDVLDGLTGFARYLLLRGGGTAPEIEELLISLVSMVDPVEHAGRHVPRYWSTVPPNWRPEMEESLRRYGHLNLGLAHGIAGPLAVLATAHADGVVVPGQAEAMSALVTLLGTFQRADRYGPYWPDVVSLEEFDAGRSDAARGRVSWCYGAPGVSRAVQLAGRALGRQDWLLLAQESVASVVRIPLDAWRIDHWSLCHGWAGALHLLGYFTDGPDGQLVRQCRDRVVERILRAVDGDRLPTFAVGHDHIGPGREPAGFLGGAAGLALALDDYAAPGRALPWPSALAVM